MATTENNRASPRHEFAYEQLVAAVADGEMPSMGDFRTVPCEDVSCGGIAFLLNDEPAAEEYIVGLGKAPNLTYLCAGVLHKEETVHKGQMRYRVGCQFTGRARLDRSTLKLVRNVDGDSATGETVQDEQQEEAEVQPPLSDESKSQEAGEGNTTVARQTA